MSAASDLPAKIASRYLPVRLIGKGGMGVVYEVVHAHTGEHLALKVLQGSAGAPAEALDRFKREARAPAQIKSENVVHVSDADVAPELDGAPFLVMELLEGLDLEQAAARSKPDPATVVGWLRQIAPALDKAHRLGIIHRDLKPENLFLTTVEDRPPVVKILDFGIAKMAEEGSAATVSGQVLGTPKYMAPEQAARHPRVTPATDRYALGLIAYRLLVGESYHRGAVMSILAEVMHGAPSAPSTRNPSLGPAFDTWFMQACHREPERRFASASEQIEALAEALGLPAGTATDATPAVTARPGGRNSRRALAAGALLAVAAVALFATRRGSDPRHVDAPASAQASATASAALAPAPVRELPPKAVAPAPTHETTAAPVAPAPSSAAQARLDSSNRPARKARPHAPRPATGAPESPPQELARDPFIDQK
jgi:serine/threonine-protein kinase